MQRPAPSALSSVLWLFLIDQFTNDKVVPSCKSAYSRPYPDPIHRLRPGCRLGHCDPFHLSPRKDQRHVRVNYRPRIRRRIHWCRVCLALHRRRGLHQVFFCILGCELRGRWGQRAGCQRQDRQDMRDAQGLVGIWNHELHILCDYGNTRLDGWER